MTAILVSAGAFLSALAGGVVALRAARWIGVVIALGAGIRIGAAYFDLIPEAVTQLGSMNVAMLFTAIGFLAFYAVEKLTSVHVGHETASELDHGLESHRHVGLIGASGMSVHSFLDGVALAAALDVGGGLALVVAAVVVVHRFSDGIGIVSLLLATRTPMATAYRWVLVMAAAPLVGVAVGLVLPIPERVLGALLAVFAGFFLYIGAAELLPEAHRTDRSTRVVIATLLGVAAVYAFSIVAGVVAAPV
jgi:ZIP family zinc transporter